MTFTILALEHEVCIDVIVKPEQRIGDVFLVLTSNMRLPFELALQPTRLYSRRKKRYINERLTFKQAGLFTGDVLEISLCSEVNEKTTRESATAEVK